MCVGWGGGGDLQLVKLEHFPHILDLMLPFQYSKKYLKLMINGNKNKIIVPS